MKTLSHFMLLCCTLVLAGAWGLARSSISIPRWDSYTVPVRVACVGDSITNGYGHNDARSYPSVLGRILGSRFNVQNFGVSGTTMLQHGDDPYWVTPEFTQALGFQPDVVIIKLGTNDSKPQNWNKFKGEYLADYRLMLQRFSTLPSKPLLRICLPVPVYKDGVYDISAAVVKNEMLPMLQQLSK